METSGLISFALFLSEVKSFREKNGFIKENAFVFLKILVF